MKRTLLCLALVCSLASVGATQQAPVSFESMLIDGTADGLLASTRSPGSSGIAVSYCAGTVLKADFNYRVDGGTATAADSGGDRVVAGAFFELRGSTTIANFSSIRVTATNAIWNATCYR